MDPSAAQAANSMLAYRSVARPAARMPTAQAIPAHAHNFIARGPNLRAAAASKAGCLFTIRMAAKQLLPYFKTVGALAARNRKTRLDGSRKLSNPRA